MNARLVQTASGGLQRDVLQVYCYRLVLNIEVGSSLGRLALEAQQTRQE
jgi:hypothetical protein